MISVLLPGYSTKKEKYVLKIIWRKNLICHIIVPGLSSLLSHHHFDLFLLLQASEHHHLEVKSITWRPFADEDGHLDIAPAPSAALHVLSPRRGWWKPLEELWEKNRENLPRVCPGASLQAGPTIAQPACESLAPPLSGSPHLLLHFEKPFKKSTSVFCLLPHAEFFGQATKPSPSLFTTSPLPTRKTWHQSNCHIVEYKWY